MCARVCVCVFIKFVSGLILTQMNTDVRVSPDPMVCLLNEITGLSQRFNTFEEMKLTKRTWIWQYHAVRPELPRTANLFLTFRIKYQAKTALAHCVLLYCLPLSGEKNGDYMGLQGRFMNSTRMLNLVMDFGGSQQCSLMCVLCSLCYKIHV